MDKETPWIDTLAVRTRLVRMKNITLSADEGLIAEAREAARARRTTLNQMFREWLAEVAGRQDREQRMTALLERLSYVDSGGPFTREEMNER